MIKYRRKLAQFDALQFKFEKNLDECLAFCPELMKSVIDEGYLIRRGNGFMVLEDGDWIVKDQHGRFMYMTDDQFKFEFERDFTIPSPLDAYVLMGRGLWSHGKGQKK